MNETQITDLILEEAADIQDTLNNTLLKEFASLHNIPDEQNYLVAKQENIAKRAYFLKVKKKYALWIVNKEGVPCAEFDLKGIVVRRSDYPAITKIGIQTLLNYLLKEEKVSFVKIRKFIEEERVKIMDMCLSGSKEVARPVSFSNKLESYKKVPTHVKSMILWNEAEYPYFVPGTKGYSYFVKGVDPYTCPDKVKKHLHKFQKIKYVVVPYEEDKLPSYYKIDLDAMIEFVWDKRVKEILEAVMDKVYINRIENREISTW